MFASALPSNITTIIVDDEPVAIHRLRQALQVYPQVHIIGEAYDGITAAQLINKLKPQLVFLDIRIPGSHGFEVLQALTHQPAIVFVTAYEEYAVKAFEKNSLDYLLKPFDDARLALTMKRVELHRNNQNNWFSALQQLLQAPAAPGVISTIPVKTGEKIQLIHINDVIFFEAKEKYVALHTHEAERLIEYSLTYLEARLPAQFVRVHRGFIINKLKIQEMQKYFKGTFIITMQDNRHTKIKTAYSYADAVKAKLLLI
ncbi:LytTR family two component transcriptional regulator [Chitinophaga skermanii]|uniref:LytTR family two component transcriptional regulator n=1 Tax=Chitinophaga skermanii TaxID=331697 RepID=A0A327R414_9BACT|nr:LytTR family DNA-binding domain-containing protein [Chitinophaga skermanii]RAJ10692.1 LytTR family two component transcriptional regulator [Chitinophaga skermanii]